MNKELSKELSKGQSRKMSFAESTVSVLAGYIITVLIQFWIYPLFGISIATSSAFFISIIIVFSAFVKNLSLRRLFNYFHVRAESS